MLPASIQRFPLNGRPSESIGKFDAALVMQFPSMTTLSEAAEGADANAQL